MNWSAEPVSSTRNARFFNLLHQALTNLLRSYVLSFLTEERRVVDREQHAHGWLVNLHVRKRLWILSIGDGITNLKPFNTVNRYDLTSAGFFDLRLSETFEGHQLQCAFLTLPSRKQRATGIFSLDRESHDQ